MPFDRESRRPKRQISAWHAPVEAKAGNFLPGRPSAETTSPAAGLRAASAHHRRREPSSVGSPPVPEVKITGWHQRLQVSPDAQRAVPPFCAAGT